MITNCKLHGFTNAMINKHIKDKEFDAIEQHWIQVCTKNNIPPALARFIYWDTKQKKLNSRYWSYLFETETQKETLNKIEEEYMETYVELNKAKEEFVDRIVGKFVNMGVNVPNLSTTAPKEVPKVKGKDKDDPDTVGGLINWFLTCDATELKEITVAKWNVKRSGLKNFILQCKNHQFSNDWKPIFARPIDHDIVIGNADILSERKHYGIENTITNELFNMVDYMLSFEGMSTKYNTHEFTVYQVDDLHLRFNINNIGLLFMRYDMTTPYGFTLKLSSDKLTIEQAKKECWSQSKFAISNCNDVCYIVPASCPVIITNEAEDYHYNEIINIIDRTGSQKFNNCLYKFVSDPRYAENKGYKSRCDRFLTEHKLTKRQLETNYDNTKISTLKCMTDPKYGSCRFTKMQPAYEIKLEDALCQKYSVTATVACVTDLEATNSCLNRIYVRGCLTIKLLKDDRNTFPILTNGWAELIIPNGITVKEDEEQNKQKE